MRSRMGIAAGALLAALLLGYAALHTPPARRLALRSLTSRLERSGIVARADTLDYNIAALSFHFSNLTLATPSSPTEPFFTARDVRVTLARSILFGHIAVRDLTVEEPRVTLVSSPSGARNWPGDSSPRPAGTAPLRVSIERARVVNLGVRWSDSQSALDVGVSLDLAPNGNGAAGRIVATRPGRIEWRNRRTSIDAIDGRLSWNGGDAGIEALKLRLPEGTIDADGRIDAVTSEPRLALHVVADASLAALAPWLDLDRPLSGTARADVILAGPIARPEASFTLTARNVITADVPPVDFAAEGRIKDGAAEVASLRAQIANGSVTASGRTAFDGPGSARVEWQNVDLASLVRAAASPAPNGTRVEPSALLGGRMDAKWTTPALGSLELTAEARATSATSRTTRTLPVDGAISLAIRALEWRLSTDDIGIDGARMSGRAGGSIDPAAVSRSTMTGSVHLAADDAARLAGALARAGVASTATAVSGRAAADFTLSGQVGAPVLDGPLRARIVYGQLPPADIHATTSIAPAAVSVREIEVALGASSARGDVSWNRESDALRGALEASLAIDDFEAAAGRRLAAEGRLGASVSLSGTLAHATATVSANGTALTVAGQPVDRASLDASVDIARSRFVVDRLALQSGTGQIDGRGEIDLTRDTYVAHVTATDAPIAPLTGVADEVIPITGRLSGSFDGEGSFKDLSGRGQIALAGARWKESELGPISATVTLEGTNAIVSAEAPELALNANGSIGTDQRGAIAIRADWKPTDLSTLAERFGVMTSPPVGGSANISVQLNGTRDHLDELRSVATLNALDLTASGQNVHLSRPGQIDYDGRIARAGNIAFTSGSSVLVLDGAIGTTGPTSLTGAAGISNGAAARGLTAALDGSLADFAFLRDLLMKRPAGAAPLPAPSGSIQLRLAAEGTVARPVLNGTLQIAGGIVPLTAEQRVSGLAVDARLDAGVLTIGKLDAELAGATLSASGLVPTDAIADKLPASLRQRLATARGPARFTAKLTALNAGVLAPFINGTDLSQLGGQIDATVQLEADRLSLDRLRGTVTLDRSDLALGGVPFDQQVPTRVALRDGRLVVEAWEWGRDDNRLTLRGSAGLGPSAGLDLVATSVLDLRVLNILAPGARVSGRADTEIRVNGTMKSPRADGWVTFSNGEVRVANPRLIVGDITGTVTLAADTVTFQRMFASVNGGDSEIAGTIRHHWFTPLGGRVTMVTTGAALAIEGLRAEANLDIALVATPERPVVTGTVTLVRSAYREQLSLTSGLLRALQAPSASPLPAAPSPLDRLRLDVRIVTQSDLLVDNNYGKLPASADLRLVGTATRPSLTGRATLGEGGALFFGGRRYRLDEGGTIDFVNQLRVEPDVNLSAVTNVQGAEIQLKITGTPSTLQTTLTSPDHPEYSQSDLVSLLLIGRPASEATSASAGANGTQLLGLLSGEFLGSAGQALGLSTLRVENSTPDVRFDAGLVATETDPGARLTIGRNIGSRVEVVFSQSLQQSGELTWIVSYAPKTNFVLRVVNLDSGERIYDFRHDLTFGRPANTVKPVPRPRENVVDVQMMGAGATEAALRSRLKLREGDRFSFFSWQDDRERIEDYYHERDRLEARVIARRVVDTADATRISLTYDIRPGPQTTVQVQGYMLPQSTLRDIRQAWTGAVVNELLGEEAVRIARDALVDAGYVQASVTPRIRSSESEKELTLLIETGTQASKREVRFMGNHGEPSSRLQAVLADPILYRSVWTDPDRAQAALVAVYRANGYLNASVRMDPIVREGGTVIRPIQIEEGEPFRIREVRVEGARALSPAMVLAGAGLSRGEVITELKMEQARIALDQSYRSQGFNSVAVTIQSESSPDSPAADISVRVDEGRQQRLHDVVTKGLEHTRPSLVSRALRLTPGQPVDLAAWNESRRRLYETGAFRSVDIEREPVEESAVAAPAQGDTTVEPVRALVTLQEWPRFRFRYGLEVNDSALSTNSDPSEIVPAFEEGGRELSLGATTDFAARNLFGRAVTAGVAARYTKDFRAVRTYATMPTFFGRRIVSNAFLEQSREGSGTTITGLHPAFVTDLRTFRFEQRIRPRQKVEISYSYKFERNHTYELHTNPSEPFPFDIDVRTASLSSGILMDRRNDIFDTTSGWFHASNVEWSPDWLSPDTRLAKYSAEQRYFHRFGRLVLASWGRIGLATGFEQNVLPADRFFVGGVSSVRGYADEALSPKDFFGSIVGGNSQLILNQEVRFPLFPYVRGVAFIDAGRAFETVSNLSFRDLSAGTGVGFRIQTPVVMIRIDMGVPLDSSVAPRTPRWYFSIGQLF